MIELPSPLRAVIFQSIVERLWLQLNLVMYSTSDFIYAVMWNAFDMYLILYGILNKEKNSWSHYLWILKSCENFEIFEILNFKIKKKKKKKIKFFEKFEILWNVLILIN